MALTEKQIDDLVEAILHGTQEKYVQEMSDLMVDRLAQGFSKLGDEAALNKLAETFPSQSQTILTKYQDAISNEVHDEVEAALNESVAADLDQLKKIYGQERTDVAKAYFAMGATAHFATLARTTADQIADIVRRQNILMEQQAEQKWYQVSQDAINAVVLGTKPTEKALADGVVDLMNAGIMVIDYGRDGKATVSNMADVALRRHIVSQVSQVGGQMSLEAMQSYGHEFAITSAHFGARPSHAKWQGLPGCLSGEKTVDGTTYPDFYELTGYMGLRGPNVALGDRLKGVNCRHSMHPFFPGITELPDREFKEAQAKYGKSSDEYYANLQRQRELERRIRKTKREIVGMERAGLGLESPTYVQKRLVLGKQQRMLNKHCKDNKLVRLYNREKAYGVSSQPRALIRKPQQRYSIFPQDRKSLAETRGIQRLDRKRINALQRDSDIAFSNMSVQELASLKGYTTGLHNTINQFLYGMTKLPSKKKQRASEAVVNIDKAISKFKLRENLLVFSGTEKRFYENWKVGDIRELKGYVSSSVRFRDAHFFYAREQSRGNQAFMIEILVPKGTKCLFVGDNTSYFSYQGELILSHGLQYRVLEKEPTRMLLEVVSDV